jgi:hypothetical protein
MLLKWRGNLHFPDARLENTIAARMTLAVKIRELKPRVVILPYYASQYGETIEGGTLFPGEREIRERLGAVARFYGNLIGVRYGEPFVVKEAMQIDDIVTMPSRSI